MICKACKREIPEESIFCLHCGEKVVRSREKKKEVSVPKPRQLPSGTWFAQLTMDKKRYPVSANTKEEYYIKARALKSGLLETAKSSPKGTLGQLLREYIDSNTHTLSPSTIRGYEIIFRNRFKDYINKPWAKIDFQHMVNAEAKIAAPKTVVNAWGLVSAALTAAGETPPKIKKPTVPASDEDWLDFEQIKLFVATVRGTPVELAALLALHGLRRSELLDLTVEQITPDGIQIRGATVFDSSNKMVHKATNKNKTSRRTVPILIPRVLELLPQSGKAVTQHPSAIYRGIAAACKAADLPICSAHDLRRSFASLAYHLGWNEQTTMQVGGWADLQTINAVYRKLAAKDKNADIGKMQAFYTSEITNKKTNEK